jgi:hypothetical protein
MKAIRKRNESAPYDRDTQRERFDHHAHLARLTSFLAYLRTPFSGNAAVVSGAGGEEQPPRPVRIRRPGGFTWSRPCRS